MIAIIFPFITAQRCGDIRQNEIKDDCNFEKIRIPITDVTCEDLGFHKKYCNHYSLPKEFVISKELSYNGNHYDISPKAMYDSHANRKVANFYYNFNCDKEGGPKLELNIVPRNGYDKDPKQEFIEFIFVCVLILLIVAICPCISCEGFLLGLIFGCITKDNRGYYCK